MKLNFLANFLKKDKTTSTAYTKDSTKPSEAIHENSSEEFLENGKAKISSGNYLGAIEDFTKAIELEPTSISGYLERSKAKRELKDTDGADKDFEKGNRLFQNLDEGLKANDEGDEYYYSSDYKNAIKTYNKAIRLVPELTSLYYYRGCSKQYLEDYKGAVEDFNTCIQLNASNKAEAYYQRSIIKSFKLNDKSGALEDLNIAIKLSPNEAKFYYSRAKLQDDYDGLQDLNRAVDLEPKEANNYLSRSLKKRRMEDYEGSISDITKYIELKTEDDTYATISQAYSLRGGMKLLSNDLEGALLDRNLGVKADPLSSNAFLDRGIIKDLLRDYEGAATDFSKAIELDPENAGAFYNRGLLRKNIGLENESILDLKKAKELGYEE